jgi:ElaB/YqjD/DUF883 family membrane-anchored ribosome-binding protein
MASTADTINDASADARAQIKQLRDQVDALMRERVSPMISDAAGRAQDAARHAQEVAQEQIDQLSGHVRETPITSVLIAAAVGFLIGRIAR